MIRDGQTGHPDQRWCADPKSFRFRMDLDGRMGWNFGTFDFWGGFFLEDRTRNGLRRESFSVRVGSSQHVGDERF